MDFKRPFKNQSGLSMIESMIAGSMILGTILLMGKAFRDQMGSFNEKEKTLFSKQIAYEMVSNASYSPKDLPPLYFEDKPLTSIRCFDFKGVPLNTETSMYLTDDKKEKPSGLCNMVEGGATRRTYVEIQQWYTNPSTLAIFDKEGAVTDKFKMVTIIPSAY